MPVNRNQLWVELELIGEEEVRARYSSGSIYGHDKRPLVKDWLDDKAQERADAFKREEIAIARDAATAARDSADAARDAAREAKQANTIAKIAIAVATTAAIVSIIGITSN